MMPTYLIRFEKKKCIGAGVCEAFHPDRWKLEDDNKARLIGSTETSENIFEVEIDETELEKNKQAADGCPPRCIHIINKETGEELKLDR